MITNLELLPQYQNVTVEPRHSPDQHWYYVSHFGEDPLPSVTTCLGVIAKPDLIPWARKMGRESVRQVLLDNLYDGREVNTNQDIDAIIEQARQRRDPGEQAAEEGTTAHQWVDAVLAGESAVGDVPPLLQPAVIGALAFIRYYELMPVATEFHSWHPTYGSPGTIDLVARDTTGRLVIGDWKRSRGLYPEMAYQVAAYSKNVEALTGEKVAAAYVVRLPRETPEPLAPQYEAKRVANLEAAWHTFLSAQELFLAQRVKVW